MSLRPPALGAFHAALAERLDELGPNGLRALLERRAATLRPSEREAFLALLDPVEGDDVPPPPTPLADRLLTALAAVPADPARVDVARQRVALLAERVLGAKDRPAYEIAAAMVVLLAQSTALVDGGEPATVIDEYDHRYRRFSAFRGELRDARAAAGLLAP